MKRKKKLRFIYLQVILAVYIIMFGVVLSVGRNVLYSSKKSMLSILNENDFSGSVSPEKAQTVLIWEGDETGKDARTEMTAILSQMRIPFTETEASGFTEKDLSGRNTAVLAVTDLNLLGSRLTSLLNWVIEGNSLLFLYSPDNEAGFIAIADRLGITGVGNTLSKVEGLHFTSSIMPGSGRDLAVSDPYRSSLEVTLDDECEVFLEAAGSSQTPLIWRRKLGDGTVVFDNLNFLR